MLEQRIAPSRLALAGCGLLLGLCLASAATAQLGPAGPVFQVNTYTESYQQDQAACAFPDGTGFVVVWESRYQDGEADGVFGQRYDAAGNAVASEFQVNTYTGEYENSPDVCCRADGSFVVVWDTYGLDGDDSGIFAQRFQASGAPDGLEFQVNQATEGGQYNPSLCCSDTEFVVSWNDYPARDIEARRFTAAGAPIGGDFVVNSQDRDYQYDTSLCCHQDGGFVVAWEASDYSGGADGDGLGVFARRFAAGGAAIGSDFQVNVVTSGYQNNPEVCCPGDGSFIVSWDDESGLDGDDEGVFARIYDAAGAPAPPFQVNTYTPDDQEDSSICCGADGRFIIAWESLDQDGEEDGVFAQAFAANGSPLGAETQINTYTFDDQDDVAVACADIDNCLFTWEDGLAEEESDGQDGSVSGVFARLFAVPSVSVLEIPTLGGLGALGLVTLLGGAGLWSFRRRRD